MNIKINNVTLYYEEYGYGTPVICLHGFCVDSNLMKKCLEPIFKKYNNYKRIYLDLIGMGKTPSNRNIKNTDDMLEYVKNFIKEIIGDEKFILFGESYGGYLSLGLIKYLKSQILGEFLICPCIIGNTTHRTLPKKQLIIEEEICLLDDEKDIYHSFLDIASIVNKNIWHRYKSEVLVGLNQADYHYLEYLQNNGYSLSFEQELFSISFNAPVTIMLGKQDNVVGYEDALRLRSNFSKSTFIIINRAGHNLQIESSKLFTASVIDFLDQFYNYKNT